MMRIPTLVAVSLIIFSAPVSTSYATDEPPTCDGRPATILVTESGATVVGTDGPDVVVIDAAYADVDALGGDDAICVYDINAVVRAGAGDDLVIAETYEYATALLGPGEDRFVGGDEGDTVFGGDENSDLERDEISTGSWKDSVMSGTPGHANDDVIHAGPMADLVTTTPLSPSGVLDLGGGDNSVRLLLTGDASTTLEVDVAAAAVTLDGASFPWQGGVRRWSLATDHPTTLSFKGTDLGETLELPGPVLPQLYAKTHGGPDKVYANGAFASGSKVALGSGGADVLTIYPISRHGPLLDEVNLDLAYQVLDFGTPTSSSVVTGVEQVGIEASRVWVRGDDRDNDIIVGGCSLKATGGAGADKLTASVHGADCRITGRVGRLEGGRGRDRLFGSRGDDVLFGGPGRDVADGDRGIDTCRAEVTRNCERS
jgi:Ca2+-binding RTX toxin-like protein